MNSVLARPEVAGKTQTHKHPFWKRQLIILSRWLHIYLSMASFGILFFFAVTGLTLNHADWFSKQQQTIQSRGTVNHKFLGSDVGKLEIVEQLRNERGLH